MYAFSFIIIFVLSIFSVTLNASNLLQYVVVPQPFADTYGAACLDSSPPSYYISLQDPNRFIIFIEGGGWAFDTTVNGTIAAAASRAMGGGGSSKYNGATMNVGGMLSTDPTINPYFYNYSMVFIHYCDGSSHSSDANAPIPVPMEIRQQLEQDARNNPTEYQTLTAPSQIYFRGRANLLAILNYLKQNTTIGTASEIIVSGGSAGATSVYLGLDAIPSLFPNAKILGAPDAGYFLDAYNVGQQIMWFRTCFQAADQVWNSTGSGNVNQRCLQAYPNETWKCFLPQYFAVMIITPYIILNSGYDIFQVVADLQLGCVPSTNGQSIGGYPSCNAEQLTIMQAYHVSILEALVSPLSVPSTGAFIDSCFVHETNVDYCSSQALPNCVGWRIYNITLPMSEEPTTIQALPSINMVETTYQWYSNTVNNWNTIIEERKEFMRTIIDPAITNGIDVIKRSVEYYFQNLAEEKKNTDSEEKLFIPRLRYKNNVSSDNAIVQIIDQVNYPNNPTCPFPTPAAKYN